MWGSVNVEPGETLSAAFTITNPHAAATVRLRIYDDAGALLETLTSTSATGTLTSAALDGGRYTAEVRGGRTDGAATDMLTASFVLTATGTMTVNPAMALWDDGENCPRRKECA
jgi:flagellar hook assembly protein FlgD